MTDNKIEIEAFHNQPSEEDFLFRYMTIDKLLDFLFSGRISLTRLNEFEDKLEGVDIRHLLLNFAGNKIAENSSNALGGMFKYITLNVFPTPRNNFRRQREIFQKTNFATCWYISNHESVAMWQLYSKPDSVAIRIPYKNLSAEILNYNFALPNKEFVKLKYGSVDYYRFNDIDELSDILIKDNTQGFIKDSSFSHEREFRIIIEERQKEEKKIERKPMILDEQIDKLNSDNNVKVIGLSLSKFKELPFEIIFHPQSSDWHRMNILKIMDKFGILFKTKESSLKEIFK